MTVESWRVIIALVGLLKPSGSSPLSGYYQAVNVVYTEPNYIAQIAITPDDTYFDQQWGL